MLSVTRSYPKRARMAAEYASNPVSEILGLPAPGWYGRLSSDRVPQNHFCVYAKVLNVPKLN